LSGWLAAAWGTLVLASGREVFAVGADPELVAPEASRAAERRILEEQRSVHGHQYFHWFGSVAVGRGLRFNNPYRLEKVTGDRADSVSISALYLDVSAGVAQGAPSGFQHGISLGLATALTGIRQEVLTPSYRLLYRPHSSLSYNARLGLPLVLEPDVTGGGELGVAAIYHFLAGLGVYTELIGSLFFGAATLDRSRTTIPMFSAQLGLWADYEVFK
jgi:hypothetical protein